MPVVQALFQRATTDTGGFTTAQNVAGSFLSFDTLSDAQSFTEGALASTGIHPDGVVAANTPKGGPAFFYSGQLIFISSSREFYIAKFFEAESLGSGNPANDSASLHSVTFPTGAIDFNFSSTLTPADTSSFYISSSVSLNVITFNQGDGSTDTITVDTGSSSDFSLAGTGVLSGSVFTGSNVISGSEQIATNISGAIDSLTGSFYLSSSVENNVITFNQGDGGTDTVTVNLSLAGTDVVSGSVFTGTNVLSGSVFTGSNVISGSEQIATNISGAINSLTGSFYLSSSVENNVITFNQGDGGTDTVTVNLSLAGTDVVSGSVFTGTNVLSGSVFTGTNVISGSEQIATNISGAINSLTSSFYISSSVSLNVITFNQGDGGTDTITVNTGSGNTTITGTDTHVLFFDGADNPAGDSGLTYDKTTDTLKVANGIEHIGDPNTGIFFANDTIDLKGNNALIAQFDTTRIDFFEDIKSQFSSTFLSNQGLNWGNYQGLNLDASSGFRSSGGKAYTHVTPQYFRDKYAVVGVPMKSKTLMEYPDNYLVYGPNGIFVTPGRNPDPDVDEPADPKVAGGLINVGVGNVGIIGDLEVRSAFDAVGNELSASQSTPGIRIAAGEASGSIDPAIYFYGRDNKPTVSGSFFYSSASAEIRFDTGSNSVKFFAGSTNESLTEVLHISKSGDNPRIGIGTSNPIRVFDFKEIRDDNKGGEILIRGSRSTKGAENNDEVGRINFAIDSASFNKIDTSGSAAEIVAIVDDIDPTGVQGSLSLRVAATKRSGPVQKIKINQNGTEFTGSAKFSAGITATSLDAGSRSILGELRVGTAGSNIGTGVLSVQDYGIFAGGLKVGSSEDPGTNNLLVDGNTTLNGAITTIGNATGDTLIVSGSNVDFPSVANKSSVSTTDDILILDGNRVKKTPQNGLPYISIGDGVVPGGGSNELLMFSGSGGTKKVKVAPGVTHNAVLGYSFSSAGSTSDIFAGNALITTATITNGIITRITASGDISSSGTITANEYIGLPSGLLSSSAQIASDISGSFVADSASFSTRVTANDAKLTANTSNVQSAGALMDSEVTTLGLIKGLTGTMISGAFTSDSASFSTRVTANDAKVSYTDAAVKTKLNTDNVVSASGAFTNNEFIVAVGTNAVTSSDALAVDSDGNLGIGTPNPEVRLHMLGEAPQTTQILMEQFNNTADAPDIRTRRYRGTSASRADVQTGDYLFRLNVHGQDDGTSELYGSMRFDVDGSDQDAMVWGLQTRDTNGTVADRITIDSSGNVDINGILSLGEFSDVSASLAAAVAGGDNLGNHTATQDLNMGGNAITSVGNVDGRDLSTDGTKLDGIEANADVTDTSNVTAAGALMDSEVTTLGLIKGLTGAMISGAFTSDSASFSTRVTANDAKLTANTSNVTTAGALMDSEVTTLGLIKGLTGAMISGAFTADSASFSTRVTANDAKLTANTSNVTTAGALMDSEVTTLGLIKGLTGTMISGAFNETSASLAAAIPTNNNQLTNGAGYTTNTGTVDTTGTPANNQIAIFTDADTVEGDSDFTWDGTTLDINGQVDIDEARSSGAIVDISNTYSGIMGSAHYALKVEGGQANGTPGSAIKAYGGHFTAGNTNGTNPDTIALYAQGHEDGAPNSYAAIFSGSAGGVVGINTLEPTVELEVSGDGKFSGTLEIGGIADVSASIAAAGGGGGSGTVTEVTVGTGLDITNGTTTPNITLDLSEVGFTGTANGLITSDNDGTVTTESTLTYNGTRLDLDGTLNFPPGTANNGIMTRVDNQWESTTLESNGEYIQVGTAISRTQHYLYNLGSSGWVAADADAASTSTGFLGVAVDGSTKSDFLIKGVFNILGTNVTDGGIGKTVYISTSPGVYTCTAPTATGDIVRAVGHIVDSFVSGRSTYYKIYFNPSPDFIEN